MGFEAHGKKLDKLFQEMEELKEKIKKLDEKVKRHHP